MERIAMSQEERDWLELLKRAKDKVVSQRKAAQTMGVSERWVRKLLQRMKSEGDGVVVHGCGGGLRTARLPWRHRRRRCRFSSSRIGTT